MGERPARWILVLLPYATFAVAVRGGRIVEAAPIAWKTVRKVGNDEHAVAAEWRRQGAIFKDLD